MTILWKYYSANLQEIYNNIGPKLDWHLDWQFLLSLNILSFWTYHVINFPKVSRIISSPNHHFRVSIFVLETLKLEWKCSQYLEMNPTRYIARSPWLAACIELFLYMMFGICLSFPISSYRSRLKVFRWSKVSIHLCSKHSPRKSVSALILGIAEEWFALYLLNWVQL